MQALMLYLEHNPLKLRPMILTFEDRAVAEKMLEEAGFQRHGIIPNTWFSTINWRQVEHQGHMVPAAEPWRAEFVEIGSLTADSLPRDKSQPECLECSGTGLLRKGHSYCTCLKGKRMAEEAMVAGEHGL